MADDTMVSAATHAAALITGGGASGVFLKFFFGGFLKRLDGIDEKLEQLVEKADARHEKLIVDLAEVKRDVQAAHRRIDDELPKRRRR